MDNASDPDKNAPSSPKEPDELSQLKDQLQTIRKVREKEKALLQHIVDSAPGILWTTDKTGVPVFLSKTSMATTRIRWQSVEQFGWPALVDESEKVAVQSSWDVSLQKGEAFEVEWPLQQEDGSTAWHIINAKPVRNSNGIVTRWFGACRNINGEKNLIAALQTASKTRSDFVAQISHELRTPLNGILPMVEMMLRGDLSSETRTHALTLKEAGESLLNIINDILDFSKLEAGKLPVTTIDFDLIAVVEGVAQILSPAAASKGLFLSSSISSAVPVHASGDPQRLRQVLLNLCGNAIKFTDQGQVIISVTPSHPVSGRSGVTFSVADTGPGFDNDFKEHLFEPFFQGSGKAYRNKAGTGLGLSISKRFVELMGGKMFVESEPDAGSTFGFTLPMPASGNDKITEIWNTVAAEPWKLDALTFEPCHKGRWAIAETLGNLGISVMSADNIECAFKILKNNTQSVSKPMIVLVDMIRFQTESRELLHKIGTANMTGLVRIVEVVSDNSDAIETSDRENQPRLVITMPLPRQAILTCLSSINESLQRQPGQRTRQSTTLQMLEAPTPTITGRLGQPGQKKIALVADDNEINRFVAMLFLTDMGFEVDLANDGVEAVQAFKSKHYDLVFLDCQMPRINGFEAAEIIKGIQARRQIAVPVIAVTANAVEGTREDCLAHDMDDYLSKPIDPQILENIVETWLGTALKKASFQKSSQTVPVQSTKLSRSIVNLSKLRNIFSESQITSLLELFVENHLFLLRELHTLLAANDDSTFMSKLYSFKGSCETLEAEALADVCVDISQALKQNDRDSAGNGLRRLAQLFDLLQGELSEALVDRSTVTLPVIRNSPQ